MPTKYSAVQINAVADRKIFFDANVLIYLFWPTGSQNWEATYSKIYGSLITQKNELLVDYLVVAETINVALRTEYRKHLLNNSLSEKTFSYKDFRNSSDGESAVNDIYLIVKHSVLDMFSVVGKNFSLGDMISFLSYDTLDFNDKAIQFICKENDYLLLTNDRDFVSTEIDILTANPILLAK